jgi:hypothetical protein
LAPENKHSLRCRLSFGLLMESETSLFNFHCWWIRK